MTYTYKTKGTCSTQIDLELEGNIVHNVKFTGGCNGNLQAIPKLVEGLTVEQVEEKIGGISCNGRPTSCGDQLAKATPFILSNESQIVICFRLPQPQPLCSPPEADSLRRAETATENCQKVFYIVDHRSF